MAIFFSLSVGLKVKLIFERQIEALMKNKAMKNKAKAQSKNKSWRVLKVVGRVCDFDTFAIVGKYAQVMKRRTKNKSWRLKIMEIKYVQLMREIRGWGPKILIKLGS